LVADQVYVASVPARTPENPDPQQYIFSSSSEDNDFATYPDPRGNTLEQGTEITLVLKPDALEYLNHRALVDLVEKHSMFSSSFPIYLFAQREKEVPEEPVAEPSISDEENADSDDEAVIEEVEDSSAKEVKMKTILVDEWDHLNARPSLWMRYCPLCIPGSLNSQRSIWNRDAKNISTLEYRLFYQSYFLDFDADPFAWNHFSGDLGSGISFRALLYVPGILPDGFWQGSQAPARGIRLMVKRTFITSDFGENYLPKWASWVKAVIDGEKSSTQRMG
jgi:heat shock protein beta